MCGKRARHARDVEAKKPARTSEPGPTAEELRDKRTSNKTDSPIVTRKVTGYRGGRGGYYPKGKAYVK